MVRLLEERDIDDWFEEEKKNLSEAFLEKLEKGADFEKEKEAFNKNFKALLGEYEKKIVDAEAYTERMEKLRAPFERFAEWRRQRIKRWNAWRKRRVVEKEKAKFEKEYLSLFPDVKALRERRKKQEQHLKKAVQEPVEEKKV